MGGGYTQKLLIDLSCFHFCCNNSELFASFELLHHDIIVLWVLSYYADTAQS